MDAKGKIKAAVVCGGEIKDIEWLKSELIEADFIIAADSGYDYCLKANISPDVLIGDFDSVKGKIEEKILKLSLPKKKDKTDFEVCLDYCIEEKIMNVFVYGASGGRPGHSLAAIFASLKAFKNGLKIKLISENNEMFFVDNEVEILKDKPYISIFALEKNAVISLYGFEYSLENFMLKNCSPLGVSNEITGEKGTIKVTSGNLLVIAEK